MLSGQKTWSTLLLKLQTKKDMQLKVESDGTSVHTKRNGGEKKYTSSLPGTCQLDNSCFEYKKEKEKKCFAKNCILTVTRTNASIFVYMSFQPSEPTHATMLNWCGKKEKREVKSAQTNLLQCHVKVRRLFLFHPITQGLITVTS